MAEKHKSKYKAPKDLEKSQKPKARKDLKDYTTDDKKGKMNPKSNGDTIPNLLRKTDKPFVDDGTYDVKWNADDRLYDDLENGDYDPKKALKKLKKREDKEEKEIADVIKDKKENLTRESLRDRVKKLTVEQKEALIKEYIRRKVRTAFLNEQEEKPETDVVEPEVPTIGAEAPAPGAVTEPVTPAPAETPTPAETPAEEPESIETAKQAKETVAVSKYVDSLKSEEGTFNKVISIGNVIQLAITDLDVKDQARFFIELRKMATKNLVGLQADLSKTK